MQAEFSIWWVIASGSLLLFVLRELLRQRERQKALLGPEIIENTATAQTQTLQSLADLPLSMDKRGDVGNFGCSPLFVHDLRSCALPAQKRITDLPANAQAELKAAYGSGNAFGAAVSKLLRGEPSDQDVTLYFALIVEKGKNRVIAYC